MDGINQQMTLTVGGEDLDDLKVQGSFSVSGRMTAMTELPKGAQVRVVVTDIDGQIVSTGLGTIGVLAFKQHDKDGVRWTERQHRVKVAT